jgi:large subunit ribosomal protein L18
MLNLRQKHKKRELRHRRVRSRVHGTSDRPRATIFRSLQHIYVQFIDDEHAHTIGAFDDRMLTAAEKKGKSKVDIARLVGEKMGARAKERGVTRVVFDRGSFKYHGRVRAVAEGLRATGIEF